MYQFSVTAFFIVAFRIHCTVLEEPINNRKISVTPVRKIKFHFVTRCLCRKCKFERHFTHKTLSIWALYFYVKCLDTYNKSFTATRHRKNSVIVWINCASTPNVILSMYLNRANCLYYDILLSWHIWILPFFILEL